MNPLNNDERPYKHFVVATIEGIVTKLYMKTSIYGNMVKGNGLKKKQKKNNVLKSDHTFSPFYWVFWGRLRGVVSPLKRF